jgi:hypothetical protein
LQIIRKEKTVLKIISNTFFKKTKQHTTEQNKQKKDSRGQRAALRLASFQKFSL